MWNDQIKHVFLDELLELWLWTRGLPFGTASMGCNCGLVGLGSHSRTRRKNHPWLRAAAVPPFRRRTSSQSCSRPQGHKTQADAYPTAVPPPLAWSSSNLLGGHPWSTAGACKIQRNPPSSRFKHRRPGPTLVCPSASSNDRRNPKTQKMSSSTDGECASCCSAFLLVALCYLL